MHGVLNIENDGFGYKIHFGIDLETNMIEVFVCSKGFRFSKLNDDFPDVFYTFVEEDLLWSDSMIQTFKNMIYSNVWFTNGLLKYNGNVVGVEQIMIG